MGFWKNLLSSLGGLLLGTAGIALVILSGAVLAALLGVLLVALGGFYLTSPENARGFLERAEAAVDRWIGEVRAIVALAGESLLAALGKRAPDGGAEEPPSGKSSG